MIKYGKQSSITGYENNVNETHNVSEKFSKTFQECEGETIV